MAKKTKQNSDKIWPRFPLFQGIFEGHQPLASALIFAAICQANFWSFSPAEAGEKTVQTTQDPLHVPISSPQRLSHHRFADQTIPTAFSTGETSSDPTANQTKLHLTTSANQIGSAKSSVDSDAMANDSKNVNASTPSGDAEKNNLMGKSTIYRELERFARVLAHIENSHLTPPTSKQLIDGAIKGMVATLDLHSAFLTGDELEEQNAKITSGKSASVGLVLTLTGEPQQRSKNKKNSPHGGAKQRLTVMAPEDRSPGAKAGILPGDWLTHIDGASTAGMDIDRAMTLLAGTPGTKVRLAILRQGFKYPRIFTLIREILPPKTVDSSLIEGVALLRIHRFDPGTGKATRAAIQRLTKQAGGALKGVILDLRNNPGGRLDESAKVADLFLGQNQEIYILEGRDGVKEAGHKAHFSRTEPNYPVAVLVNRGTASAAEVLAGALQDEGRALLVGGKTFGKGTIQVAFDLDDGSALKLTVAQAKTPRGRTIHGKGLTPDILTIPECQVAMDDILDFHTELDDNSNFFGTVGRYEPAATRTDDFSLASAINSVKSGLRPENFSEKTSAAASQAHGANDSD